MINDYLEIENAEGMPNLADASIALDFLLAAKMGVMNYAMALSEVKSPEVRVALKKQLQTAISLHGEITELMISKEWFYPNNLSHQSLMDLRSSQMSLQIAGLNLFPENTSRLGTFATPYK